MTNKHHAVQKSSGSKNNRFCGYLCSVGQNNTGYFYIIKKQAFDRSFYQRQAGLFPQRGKHIFFIKFAVSLSTRAADSRTFRLV